MDIVYFDPINIVGVSVRTINEGSKAIEDISALWDRFMSEDISCLITNKADDNIYCFYTDYEGDHTKPYTVVLGHAVHSLDVIPDGLAGRTFERGSYTPFQAKGNILEGAVAKAWGNIWEADIPRNYEADFEVYGEKASDPSNAEVDIFIGVNELIR